MIHLLEMKILFLSKRRPQGKDLLTRPYGRFFHIPRILAESGHDVTLLVLSYKGDPPLRLSKDGLILMSESLFPSGPFAYVLKAKRLVEQVKPDWIVGFSDTYYGILAVKLAERFRTNAVIDAYDNYESYIPWLKPIHILWRKALSRAAIVTAAGPHLAEYLRASRPGMPVHVVPMAPDPFGFTPLDKYECRRHLDLPLDRKLIGYCGAIHRSRGIEILFKAFEILRKENPSIELILSGRKENRLSLPEKAHWLGYLSDEKLPALLNSLDVLLVVNRLSDFGKFSYPVKLYEAMSCQIPVIATRTPPTDWILHRNEQFLAHPENASDLAHKVETALNMGRYDYAVQNSWEESSRLFEQALLSRHDSQLFVG
jgi:glycosyltransferase involved in cell wall biosynthesis